MGEPSMNLDPWEFKQHFACFECRKAIKAGGEFVLDDAGERVRRPVACPECGQPMAPMGRQFRAPRRSSVKAWARLAELAVGASSPPFEWARVYRRKPTAERRKSHADCPGCGSATGWDGRRCPYCGYQRVPGA